MRDSVNINYRDSRMLVEVISYYLTAAKNDIIVDGVSLPRLEALRRRLLDVSPPHHAGRK
jgi:hypothetical protein